MMANVSSRIQIGRLTLVVMAIAVAAIAGLLSYAGFSSDDNTISVYGTDNSDALELRGTVFAQCGTADHVREVVFTVALPDDATPMNLTAPPNNVVKISYSDEAQYVEDISWTAKEYVAGDGDSVLEPGETFLITGSLGDALNTPLKSSTTFTMEVRTPGDEIMTIKRTTPDTLAPVMNLE